MTTLEREALRDLDRLANILGKPWVPRQLIFLLIRYRASGNAAGLLLTLVRHGYADKKRDNSAYRKTSKPSPNGNLMGVQADPLPRGAVARIAKLWMGGCRSFSADDLHDRREEEQLDKRRRGRQVKRT